MRVPGDVRRRPRRRPGGKARLGWEAAAPGLAALFKLPACSGRRVAAVPTRMVHRPGVCATRAGHAGAIRRLPVTAPPPGAGAARAGPSIGTGPARSRHRRGRRCRAGLTLKHSAAWPRPGPARPSCEARFRHRRPPPPRTQRTHARALPLTASLTSSVSLPLSHTPNTLVWEQARMCV